MRTQDLVRRHQPPAPVSDVGGPRDGAAGARPVPRGSLQRLRPFAPDIAWAAFAGLNLAAMRLFPAWQTVPFLAIWVSLTVIYGFRLWRLQPTILTLAAVTLATGGIIGVQVIKGQQDADYLAEVPLIALMFLVMVLARPPEAGRHPGTADRDGAGAAGLPGEPAPARAAAPVPAWTPRTSWAPRSRSRSATPN